MYREAAQKVDTFPINSIFLESIQKFLLLYLEFDNNIILFKVVQSVWL